MMKAKPPADSYGLRRCTRCHERTPLDQWAWYAQPNGQRKYKAMCRPCLAISRRSPRIGTISSDRTCSTCNETKPRPEFERVYSTGRYDLVRVCADCRSDSYARRNRTPIVYGPPHPCLGGCGVQLRTDAPRCNACRKAKQNQSAADSDAHQRRRTMARVLKAQDKAVLWIASDTVYKLACRCHTCRKPIFDTGRCYECSTGHPISDRILNLRTRLAENAQPINA